MNKLLIILIATVGLFVSSCSKFSGNGELVGVGQGGKWFEPKPYGMVLIPRGSFTMGPNDQDVAWALNSTTRRVSVESFWMDETEVTNSEYRQFVYWVRDSIARQILSLSHDEFKLTDRDGTPLQPERLDWDARLEWDDEEYSQELEQMFIPENERFLGAKLIDVRKLNYKYQWYDLLQAAKKSNRYNYKTGEYEGFVDDYKGGRKKVENRSSFIMEEDTNVYPDTLCWIQDFTYSYNEPWAKRYFWHPGYNDYPVVGVSWKQARAFCFWRTRYHNSALKSQGESGVQDYRLPTEAEWEYAARGGLAINTYPWGGPYSRNDQGCFLANFKPLRGNYVDDGGLVTLQVGTYEPNEFGLYDMAGNVAEWTSGAYDESANSFTHDMNPNYEYNALPNDPPARKRKVIRGGSWKDIGYYMQCATRTYEYQDTAKSYIGFRCVRTRLGK
ncbi:MAG: SUMF1/EgtB/PvdO family nonheme iron enzyme [Marinifilaceae bacterium]|jgi:formylglycine-generating enzyme required for sulfatase activity|nr:SUMF1/EgtB/PvdO family nonheme iron enzyme [Marinifilaceae bacterium]